MLTADFTKLGGENIQFNTTFGVGSVLYADLVADLSVQVVIGFGANGDPIYDEGIAPGVDPAVYDWLNGAEFANQDMGFFGQFIVYQTEDEYNIRSPTTLVGTAAIARASNQIAYNVYEQILMHENPNGSYNIPTIGTIGRDDAAAAAGDIFGPIYGGTDKADWDVPGWSGTMLFAFLGDSNLYQEYLLSSTTIVNDPDGLNKHSPGMYDLAAALEVGLEAGQQAGLANPVDAALNIIDPPYTNIPDYSTSIATTIQNDITATNTFFDNYYNLETGNQFEPGADLALNASFWEDIGHVLDPVNTYVVGYATAADDITVTSTLSAQAVIVGGTGNNTIVAPFEGDDVIDGGVGGQNTLDLSQISNDLTFNSLYDPSGISQISITTPSEIDVDGDVVPVTRTINAYNFDNLLLGTGSNITANDTFFSIGEGVTILAGDEGQFTLSVSGSSLSLGTIDNTAQFIALPSNFVVNPTTSLTAPINTNSEMVFINENNQTVSGSLSGEILISTGSNDVLNAGTNGNTLIALTGTIGNYVLDPNPNVGTIYATPNAIYDGYDDYYDYNGGVTEIAESSGAGLISTNSTFNAFSGDNVLIGDAGNNTFNVNSDDAGAISVVWGGGGKSTYNMPEGQIIVIKTNITPTPEEVENLAKTLFEEPNSGGPIVYVIDPSVNDQILLNYDFSSPADTRTLAGTYEPLQVGGYYGQNTDPESVMNIFANTATDAEFNSGYSNYGFGFGYGAIVQSPSTIDIGPVAVDNGGDYGGDQITGGAPTVRIDNFVQGDFGISFSGNAPLFPLLTDGLPHLYDPAPASAYANLLTPAEAEAFYGSGDSSSGNLSNSSGSSIETLANGNVILNTTIPSGGNVSVLSGGVAYGSTINSGGIQIISAGGLVGNATINGGGELVNSGGTTVSDVVLNGGRLSVLGGTTNSAVVSRDGTEYVQAGGIASATVIMNDGTQIIAAGGIETGDVVSGGAEYVSSGGFVGSANVDGGSLVVSAGGQADILNVTSGLASIASGQSEILVQNDDVATVAAAGNAITTVTFNQSVSGGSLDFINNSTAAQTVFYGNQGSVTAFGGAGGGFYVGGAAGNNVLTGGSGAVTLIGGGNGDVLQANASTGLNALYAGNGTETLTASATSGENQFDLGPDSDGVISTAGSGLQGYFLNGTGGTTTITGSQSQGAFNLYEFLGDATAGGGAYTLTDFSPANSAIFLLNGTASGPSDATVSTVTGAAGGTLIGLSDGTQITLLGVAASSVQVITASNGVSVIV